MTTLSRTMKSGFGGRSHSVAEVGHERGLCVDYTDISCGTNRSRPPQRFTRKQDRPTGLVFPSPLTGGCYHAGMIQKLHLKPAGERIGIKGLGWHAFRHSYRGLLDESGANAGMQKGLMRHANISTTMNTYGRAAINAEQEANSKVVQMILPRKALCA